ncbi:MAG: hypothetical protein JXA08_04105 [Methanomicrobiaceae archaeon]|nr:hypothetical protein [Methanomicrobiaceae archaeon]
MAVSIEYFIIYLFFDSLPGTINWRDKAIICVGAIAAFLVLLKIATEGTSVGMKISDILNSYFLPKPVPIPYSLHNELINKLHLSSAAIFSEDNNVVKFAFKDFVEHGSFLIVELERKYPTEDEKINMLRAKFEDSEDKFSNICSFNCSDDSRIDAVKSVSEFIGTVNGLLNSEN